MCSLSISKTPGRTQIFNVNDVSGPTRCRVVQQELARASAKKEDALSTLGSHCVGNENARSRSCRVQMWRKAQHLLCCLDGSHLSTDSTLCTLQCCTAARVPIINECVFPFAQDRCWQMCHKDSTWSISRCVACEETTASVRSRARHHAEVARAAKE